MRYCENCHDMEKCEMYGGCWNPPAMEKPLSPSDVATCSALVNAMEDLLPHHALACVARDEVDYFYNEDGTPLITEESCQCGQKTKEYRKMLTAHKKSRKGFYPANDPGLATAPPTPDAERPSSRLPAPDLFWSGPESPNNDEHE